MKTNILSLALLSLTIFLFSCDPFDNHVVPTDKITTRSETFEDYNMIDASSAFEVFVTFSDTEESIEIEANDNLHQYIEVKKVNNTLLIGLENNVSVRGSSTLKAYITTKHVFAYAASGASRIIVEDQVDAENVNIYLSGASSFTGDIIADRLTADLSGASIMKISGRTDDLEVEASGASVFKDYGFDSQNLTAEISGASNVYVTVNHEINVEASGASSLRYKGEAIIKYQDLSGASTVKKMN